MVNGCLSSGLRLPATPTTSLSGLPFINMELVDQEGFQQFTKKTFATDRDLVPKEMIEVIP